MPRLTPELPGDRYRQVGDVSVIDEALDTRLRRGADRVHVADRNAELAELDGVEACQPELNRARRVEPGVGAEVGCQSLGQRRQPGDALGPVVERGRPSDEQVEAGKPAGVDVVDELTERVEALVAHVGADPLQGLGLVEHHQQIRVPGVAQDREQSLEETERSEVVKVALDAGRTAACWRDVGLAADPGEHCLGGGLVAVQGCPAVGA